jgi:transketolase
MLGDGAGLVYSVLGASHQCGEDVACLRPLPNIAIYSPCDAHEFRACWSEARQASNPSYLRIGKAHPEEIHPGPLQGTGPVVVCEAADARARAVIVATGAMVRVGAQYAREHGICCVSVPRLKPAPIELIALLSGAQRIAVLEEHVSSGGLWSLLLEMLQTAGVTGHLSVEPIGLRDAFTQTAGDHQHALGEHGLDDGQVADRLTRWLNARPARRP